MTQTTASSLLSKYESEIQVDVQDGVKPAFECHVGDKYELDENEVEIVEVISKDEVKVRFAGDNEPVEVKRSELGKRLTN